MSRYSVFELCGVFFIADAVTRKSGQSKQYSSKIECQLAVDQSNKDWPYIVSW